MENGSSDGIKDDVVEEPKPSQPSLIDKLKAKRWTFKVKNNFTEYITVEPLICFYMVQIFVASLSEPYHFHKACVSLDKDTYFCDVITTNQNNLYQLCATFGYLNIYCKGLSEVIENIDCRYTIHRYEKNIEKAYDVKPEDYRFCKVIEETAAKAYAHSYSLAGMSATILTFLVVMIVSIWSDKYSKRKICLMLPIIGQLITIILNLHGALSTSLSFDFINTATIFILSLSGGMPLFLFGCFSYMNNDTIRHKLLFRFGIIALILTIYRFIPYLYGTLYQYYHDDDSYINLISTSLVFNTIGLLYVKIILNESKQEYIPNALDNGSRSLKNDELQSISNASNGKGENNASRKYTKRKQVAKAFSLDVLWDYILIIFKKRIQSGRTIIIIFLAIVLLDKTSPYENRFTLIINENHSIDVIDIDGVIFVIISIMMLLLKISDAVIAILIIGMPTAARLLMAILGTMVFDLGGDSSSSDFYTPFKRIASCSLLLAYVDKNETRIFLIVQAIAHLPKVVFQIVASKENADISAVLALIDVSGTMGAIVGLIIIILLPVLVFCGLGLLYTFVKKSEKSKTEQIEPKLVGDITENPWHFIKPVNFQMKNESKTDQPPPSGFKQNDYSTHL